ncbi:WD repeat-containing protein 87-like [Canis lupus familiaris]|uniref:WD repeat-containing protein 87-like n=1 Tax=Canis lupus familiaris TaxID=9615 RepID=UPI0018F76D34|nr:WD repeat-containing protein 87-like [Canis lupus familiaris]
MRIWIPRLRPPRALAPPRCPHARLAGGSRVLSFPPKFGNGVSQPQQGGGEAFSGGWAGAGQGSDCLRSGSVSAPHQPTQTSVSSGVYTEGRGEKASQADEKPKNDVIVLSDWPETLYQEPHHPQSKPFICFYSISVNYFVSLNWMEPHSKQIQAVLWVQKKDTEMGGIIEKMNFPVMDQVPPVETMVHTGSSHMLIAYCGDMRLRLFGDHHRAFISLGTVPCRFSISCLCYDSETDILLSGTLGAVVTWLIIPNGRGLQMAQIMPMPDHELVQGFSLNGPHGSLLAFCENMVRVFTHQGQGQLKEVKKFTPIASGSSITCSFTCVSQGSFYAGNKDGEIHAWGLDQGNFLHSFQAHSSSVICVHSRPETYTLLTAGQEGVVKEWNLAFGNLLRQLNIDEDLQRLQFIDNTTFFCQTTHTFSLHHLPYFYSLFNVCGSAPEKVQRVCCGHNWTRILCATKDGLLRFLSPVTGDLLVITWPLLIMDKAMAWAYDSDKEELFVATGSSEVLVFDATHSPCTAKYLVCTSVNSRDRVRCLAYGQSHLGMGLGGLMFCGHDSGIVRILSHYSYARIEKTVHSGAVLALSTLEGPQEISLLCSYGMDHTLYLTEAVLQKNKVILQPINKILCACALTHVILLPGSVGAITENHCWRLWHYQDFLKSSESKQSSVFKETKCLHQCAITSFDVCYSLKLFVTGGIDGSVRIWDFHGRLITELDSALDFGPLCFANNRGDLLLTFNQSLYLVSCLNLLPPTQLIHLANLSSADDIQEVPKPFLPSFFLSFERIFVPKFVYLGQGLQELQGLEALLNKRVIAFDNTVPHVVEEERHMSTVIQVEPKLYFSGDKNIAFDPKHNSTPHMVPAQLQLADWDGLNSYHMLHCFFGKGQQWPFAPDGYIPNSVIRARLWPDGTPIFLRYDLYQDKDWDMTKLVRSLTLSPVTLLEENVSMKKEDKSKKWKKTFYDILVSMINQNWTGRKFDEELINHLIEAILNLTIYCSVDQYKTYITVLAQIFATYQVSSRLCYEAACRLMEDTVHPNPCIRELAWEGLERLGILSHLFAVPLAIGLMDSDENVRAKALHLMIRVTGIQTKTMLVGLLSKEETFREMQQEFIGEASLDQLLGIQAKDIQCLLTQVKQRLNENLTLSYRDQQPTFHSDISMAGEPEMLVKRIVVPEKITKPKERMTHVQAKRRQLIKKELRVSRKPIQTKFVKFSSVLVPSEDKDEQREARRSEQIDTQHVALEPELPLSTFSPAKYQEDAESKEVMVEATEEGIGHMAITEIMTAIDQCGMKDYEEVFPKVERHEVEGGGHMEVTEFMKAMGQHGNKDYGEVFPKMEKYEFMNRLWKRAVKRGYEKVAAKLKQEKDLKDISETIVEETKEKGMQITEEEIDTRKKHGKSGRGLAGMPGRIGRLDTRSWRDDICYLVTSRIASSCPGMLRDLGQELVDLAQVMLAPQDPSWDLFQEICPLLKDSSELHEKVVEEPFIITEKVDTEVVEEERTELGGQRGKKALKDKAFSQVKKKKDAFLDKLVLEKRKFKKEARKLGRQERKIAEEERKLSKTEKKLMQRKEKLTQDRKKLTHQKEKIPWDEKIVASPQEKLTSKEEQKLVLGGKKETGKGGKLLRERKRVTQKKGRAALKRGKWDWEKIMMAHEEGMWCQEEGLPTWGERKLSQEEEELGDEEEELGDEEEEEKKIAEIEKVSPQKEKQAKKEDKWVGKDKKATDEKEKPPTKKQLAPQEQKQSQEERIWSQKEKESDQRKQWAWEKEELYVEEEEHAGEMQKSQEKEERALEKRLTKKDSKLAKGESHIGKKKKAIARKGIGITKRKKKSEEEKEVMKEEELSQEERELVCDTRTKEMGVAKEKRKRTKEERIQAMRKLDMEKGIPSEDKEASSRLKDIRKRESYLLRSLAKIVREMNIVPLEKAEISEEERSSMMGKWMETMEMEGQRWEFFKEQGEIMKQEKELDQEERKVDDRLATKEKTLTDGDSLQENQRLLEKVLGKILLDKVQDEEEEEAEMEKIEKREKEEEERQKDAESRLMKVIRSEERVLKTKLSKEEVSLSKLAIEDKALAEKREGITRREMPFTKERLLDGKRYPTLRDKVMWPTVLKSPFKIPLPGAPEKERMPLKVLGVHLDLKGQESPLLGAHPMTSSWGRQEDVLLEKAKSMGTGLETQIPEGLHRLESHLSDIMKPQRREHRSKGKKWKRFFKYQDSPVGKTEGQVPGPAPALAPSLTSIPAKRPCHSEASFSDEDWITNALIRLEAGEQLSRDSFHRLHQHLRDFTSKGYLKWMHRCSLKAIAKHLRQNLEVSHTDISQPSKDVWSPVHLKVIPPIRRKQKESWLEPLSIVEPVLPSATRRSQTPEALNWHLLAESQRKKQAQQLSSAMKEIPHLYPIRKHIPTTVYPSVGKKSLDLIFQKDLQALRYKGGLPKFHMAKREALPIPSPVLPSTTKRIRVPKANLHWHLLGEPYRSARVQQLSKALREMEMKHFYPAAREIFTGAHASVDKQTLALMFQKDLGAFKGKDRPLMLPKLKKAQTTSKKKEEVPQWETFVALYYVLQMLQQRYAKDSTAWMEQFYRLMDLYQFKSPQIQRLLLELLHREELQPREIMYQKALKTQELVPGERLFCGLFCGHSHVPAGPLKFQNVVPLPGKSRVHTIQPVGIAQYGFLELAWKNLPQVNSYLIERLPNIPTPTL